MIWLVIWLKKVVSAYDGCMREKKVRSTGWGGDERRNGLVMEKDVEVEVEERG